MQFEVTYHDTVYLYNMFKDKQGQVANYNSNLTGLRNKVRRLISDLCHTQPQQWQQNVLYMLYIHTPLPSQYISQHVLLNLPSCNLPSNKNIPSKTQGLSFTAFVIAIGSTVLILEHLEISCSKSLFTWTFYSFIQNTITDVHQKHVQILAFITSLSGF